ncbi:MAG TPA: hypothetical protein PK733_09935 [Clostridiales bacterium]|mgnify:CR=1 FL=1|nr:hypothetical protein [Clostridiales bacterium]
MSRRVVNKNLIPALLAGAVGQTPKQSATDLKMLHDYNFAFNIILIAADDIVNLGDKIDMNWCIQTAYELDNGPKKYFWEV